MKKGKATVSIGLIYVILLGVFNLLVFTIFKTHTKVFWLSYAFMTVAFIVQILSMFLSFKTADVETAFFGIPLASFSIYYLCAYGFPECRVYAGVGDSDFDFGCIPHHCNHFVACQRYRSGNR